MQPKELVVHAACRLSWSWASWWDCEKTFMADGQGPFPCSLCEGLLRIAFTCCLHLPPCSPTGPGCNWAAICHPTRWLRSPKCCHPPSDQLTEVPVHVQEKGPWSRQRSCSPLKEQAGAFAAPAVWDQGLLLARLAFKSKLVDCREAGRPFLSWLLQQRKSWRLLQHAEKNQIFCRINSPAWRYRCLLI